MEIKILLDKENKIFLSKSFDLTDIQIDEKGNLVIKSDEAEIKLSPIDAMKIYQFSMQLLSQFGVNLILFSANNIGGENNEPGTTTK